MKTRTLLLLAVTCGLLILVAGTLQLLRLADQKESTTLGVGDRGQAGDAVVVVNEYREDATRAVVTVTLSGVDDPEGVQDFGLANVSRIAAPTGEGDDACTVLTVEQVTCTLTFSTDGFDGPSRQLVFRRAEEQVRWKLK